ncbi:MAG: response regulator [Planctomycetota bacterium]|nr:MAG: response regulator [Planctomycetota bacterium]REJ96099.1 MAG: response regulator [Planctomycetota bacterium]
MVAQTPSILITDDDFQFRETLRGVLEPQGYRTLLADDGLAACRIVESDTIDLVLLDVHMPRLSGLETLRRVKQVRAALPCILLSARWDEALREEAIAADAFSLLTKPVTRLDLTSAVESALGHTDHEQAFGSAQG